MLESKIDSLIMHLLPRLVAMPCCNVLLSRLSGKPFEIVRRICGYPSGQAHDHPAVTAARRASGYSALS
jgi:hypothetical protein